MNNRNAVRALTSLDQVKFADAYLAGDIDIDGDMLRPFELRQSMSDLHPLMTAWRFLQPLLMGQVHTNPLLHARCLHQCRGSPRCSDHQEV
jgi:cyclopropane-fatty-acyl-phospholipid synthase